MDVTSTLLMDSLREATWAQHQHLEKQAFNQALVNARLPQAAYIAQLQQYFLILQALEAALKSCSEPSVAKVWQADLQKTPLLKQDLDFFQAFNHLQTLAASATFIAWIRQLESENPLALLGVLYVFEGSTLGASVLLPIIRKTYALEQDGCVFYQAYGKATREHWMTFRETMNLAVPNTQQHVHVTQAAQHCFSQIAQLLAEIWTLNSRQ